MYSPLFLNIHIFVKQKLPSLDGKPQGRRRSSKQVVRIRAVPSISFLVNGSVYRVNRELQNVSTAPRAQCSEAAHHSGEHAKGQMFQLITKIQRRDRNRQESQSPL